jgi:hypothetical protein
MSEREIEHWTCTRDTEAVRRRHSTAAAVERRPHFTTCCAPRGGCPMLSPQSQPRAYLETTACSSRCPPAPPRPGSSRGCGRRTATPWHVRSRTRRAAERCSRLLRAGRARRQGRTSVSSASAQACPAGQAGRHAAGARVLRCRRLEPAPSPSLARLAARVLAELLELALVAAVHVVSHLRSAVEHTDRAHAPPYMARHGRAAGPGPRARPPWSHGGTACMSCNRERDEESFRMRPTKKGFCGSRSFSSWLSIRDTTGMDQIVSSSPRSILSE